MNVRDALLDVPFCGDPKRLGDPVTDVITGDVASGPSRTVRVSSPLSVTAASTRTKRK